MQLKIGKFHHIGSVTYYYIVGHLIPLDFQAINQFDFTWSRQLEILTIRLLKFIPLLLQVAFWPNRPR